MGIIAGSREVPGRNACDKRHPYRIIIIIIIIIIRRRRRKIRRRRRRRRRRRKKKKKISFLPINILRRE